MKSFTESSPEDAGLSWFEELGYSVLSGPSILPGELFSERTRLDEVVLAGRLKAKLAGLNTVLRAEARIPALLCAPVSYAAKGVSHHDL